MSEAAPAVKLANSTINHLLLSSPSLSYTVTPLCIKLLSELNMMLTYNLIYDDK